jgi:hypothetical protein
MDDAEQAVVGLDKAHLVEVAGDVGARPVARNAGVLAAEVEPTFYVDVELLALPGLAHVERFYGVEALRRPHGDLEDRAETVDPVGPTDGTRRALRGQHCQDNHGLRYYAISAIQVENVDNLAANNYESFRFAIHLRPRATAATLRSDARRRSHT